MATNIVGLTLKNLLGWIWSSLWFNQHLPRLGFWQNDHYIAIGFNIAMICGFWVSVFTSLVLRKKRLKRLWFVLHYMIASLVGVVGFGWLINTYIENFVALGVPLFFELPILSFIVGSGLVGWQMHGWVTRAGH
ncbi:hypothetical protein [Herpetosiphon sp. NSE202]|uniref:hypothetical protein n=1 Tax=Herpetosiphon sp. NSE202 TaxID=3351349 RepID=UPI003645C700